MTAYPNNYDFHEETLHDLMVLATNTLARTVLHNELVYIDGYFGEVCDFDGIAENGEGYLNINFNRSIKTTQVGAAELLAGDFTVGKTLYFITQTADNEGYLVDQTTSEVPATPVGIILDADEDNEWVVFRPFVQMVDLSLSNDAIDLKGTLNDVVSDVTSLKAHSPQIVELTINADATGGIDFANVDTGLAVGDKIVDMWVVSDATSESGTLTLSHGDSGADISAALTCAVANALTRAAAITGGVITADGLTVTAAGATDFGRLYVSYIKA